MLKRSFAEFHAQRAQPEALAALEKGRKTLAAFKRRSIPESFLGTTRQTVREFYELTVAIEEISEGIQVISWPERGPATRSARLGHGCLNEPHLIFELVHDRSAHSEHWDVEKRSFSFSTLCSKFYGVQMCLCLYAD